jgi:hypothetical protein
MNCTLAGWRVAQAFDPADIPNTVGAPFLRVFCEGRESEMPAASRSDHVSTTKSNSTRSIAAHPCKKRKDGAPSVGMVHAKIVKGGPPGPEPRIDFRLARGRAFGGNPGKTAKDDTTTS